MASGKIKGMVEETRPKLPAFRGHVQFLADSLARWSISSGKKVMVDLFTTTAPVLYGMLRLGQHGFFDKTILVSCDKDICEFWKFIISISKENGDLWFNPLWAIDINFETALSDIGGPGFVPLQPLNDVEVQLADPHNYLYSVLDRDYCFYVEPKVRRERIPGQRKAQKDQDGQYRYIKEDVNALDDLFRALSYTNHFLAIGENTSPFQKMKEKYGLRCRILSQRFYGRTVTGLARTKAELYPF